MVPTATGPLNCVTGPSDPSPVRSTTVLHTRLFHPPSQGRGVAEVDPSGSEAVCRPTGGPSTVVVSCGGAPASSGRDVSFLLDRDPVTGHENDKPHGVEGVGVLVEVSSLDRFLAPPLQPRELLYPERPPSRPTRPQVPSLLSGSVLRSSRRRSVSPTGSVSSRPPSVAGSRVRSFGTPVPIEPSRHGRGVSRTASVSSRSPSVTGLDVQ